MAHKIQLLAGPGFGLGPWDEIVLRKLNEIIDVVNGQPKKRKSRPRPDKFNPRDVSILGGDPSL